ncbi:hypothetical protein LTR84_007812 [Exophiala bonariae]|uniref:Uncharacterized protein n=1 Tax=Exophiala bonariae TaxID=1690606 RepID=A0AAV9NLH1_9EURO|nr:hypothetical protein LTR84_007812 [Exophiala bonariae]
MAATPPLQILSSPATPPSPLHGAKYDRSSYFPTRRSTRAATKTTSRSQQTTPDPPRRSSRVEQATTPRSPKSRSKTQTAAGLQSPEVTPKTRNLRRVQIMSPPSPNPTSLSSATHPPPTKSNSHLQPQSSTTTAILDGMLPTPVKTPKKKSVNANATTTARALFQEPQMTAQLAPVQPGPRRSRKPQRFNGFSLETVSGQNDVDGGQIQIFTDSRDRVPQADHTLTNPFIERKRDRESTTPPTVVRTSKRRKVSARTRIDPQVTDAIDKDEGMVYVFRGKKVYRRFTDRGDEEESIDEEDLGLLEYTANGASEVKPLKTLSRRSIKPKRLFQTDAQKRAREEEKQEEAATDIEDDTDDARDGPSTSTSLESASKLGRGMRTKKRTLAALDRSSPEEQGSRSSQKGSPFDSWPRLKPGRGAGSQKAKKRSANEVNPDLGAVGNALEAKKART